MIEPGSPEWLRTISPSKAAAILGVSRWESPYSLWHRMKGKLPSQADSDRFRAGHAMELALAYLWRAENPGWQLSPGEVQVGHHRFGFPVLATLDRRARRGAGSGRARRVVEFKTAWDLWEWGDPNLDGEAPADYVCQVQAQMHFTGYTANPAHIMVMGPRFRWHTYLIEYDPQIGVHIEDRCRSFHASLACDEPPELDDSTASYDAVRALNPDLVDDKAELPADLAADWLAAAADHKAGEKHLTGLKSRVLDAMGNARLAVVDGVTVGDRRPHAKGGIALYPNTKIQPDELRRKTA